MLFKTSFCPIALAALAFLAAGSAQATRRTGAVIDASTSGKVVRVNVGANSGLGQGDAVLFSEGNRRVAVGRVLRVDGGSVVVGIIEKYVDEAPIMDFNYDLVFGEPFPDADNLPDYVADRESEVDNPANERFFTADGQEINPELDDESYTPETVLRPKYPEPPGFNPHNITLGIGLFRNRQLATVDTATVIARNQPFTTYQGYAVRYAYTFRSNYWFSAAARALISAEATFGTYSFVHTQTNGDQTYIRVLPVGLELRYLVEVSKMLKLYPYLGYQSNVVSATAGTVADLTGIGGGRLLGGAGAQLILSRAMDARLEVGTDGLLAGLVVKF